MVLFWIICNKKSGIRISPSSWYQYVIFQPLAHELMVKIDEWHSPLCTVNLYMSTQCNSLTTTGSTPNRSLPSLTLWREALANNADWLSKVAAFVSLVCMCQNASIFTQSHLHGHPKLQTFQFVTRSKKGPGESTSFREIHDFWAIRNLTLRAGCWRSRTIYSFSLKFLDCVSFFYLGLLHC